MAQAQRNDIDPLGAVRPRQDQADGLGTAGNPIARLQADLLQRLTSEVVPVDTGVAASSAERLIRGLSVACGPAGLIACYAITAFGIIQWLRG